MFGKHRTVSLEITPTRFRLIELQVSSRSSILTKAVDVERSACGGNGKDHAAAANELRELLQSNGIRPGDVRIVFDAQPVSVTTLSVSRSRVDEMSDGSMWFGEKHSPIPGDRASVNCRICEGKSKDAVTVILVATDKHKVNDVLSVLNAARIKVSKMDIVPFALERLYLRQVDHKDENTAAVVGLGETNVSVLMLNGPYTQFVRYFRIFPNMDRKDFVERLTHTFRGYCDQYPLAVIEKIYFYRMADIFPSTEVEVKKSMGVEVRLLDPIAGITIQNVGEVSGSRDIGLNSLAPLVGAAL